jgi:hypothetical protein
MIRLLVAVFLAGHAFIHAAMYAMSQPAGGKKPFDPGYSRVLSAIGVGPGAAHAASAGLAWMATSMLTASATALLIGAAWWAPAAVLAVAVALPLKLLWFNPWLIVGILLDLGVLVAVSAGWPPSLY